MASTITENFQTAVIDTVSTLHGEQKLLLESAIIQAGIHGGQLADRHTLITDVKSGDPMVIIDNRRQYDGFANSDPTSCGMEECDLDLNFSNKPWLLGKYNCRIPICINSIDVDLQTYFRQKQQVMHDVDLNQGIVAFLADKFINNFHGAQFRVAYFADTSAPGGSNQALFLGSNGFFTQADAGSGYKVALNQTDPTGEQIYAALEEAYNHYMESEWSDKEPVIKMTRAMAGKLVAWLNSLNDKSPYNCECFAADQITALRTYSLNGFLTVFGIPVDVENDLNPIISKFSLGEPYRAILTPKENLLVGVPDIENALDKFDVWYDKKDRKVYLDGEFIMGAGIPTDEYVYISGGGAS